MSGRALLLIVLLAGPVLAAEPVPLGACGPIDRRFEPIELPVGRLRHLENTRIERVGLIAFVGEEARPIPFQIDERRGRHLALPEGPEGKADDRPGVLDADDLLVFMACDAGTRRDAPALARALGADVTWREIRIDDPVDPGSGFAYVVVGDHPPTTDRRYVAYDAAVDLVRAARYRVGLVNTLPNYLALAIAGPLGPNLLDGLRLRAEATLRADLAHWKLDEQQGHHQLIAWNAGPVRVVRRSRHQVVIGLGIHLTAGTAHTYFYPQHVFGPGSLRLPFSPGILFRSITAFGGADCRDLRGWRYHAPGVPPEGFAIDGRMDAREQAYDGHGEWFLLSHDGEALLFLTHLSENLARAIPIHLVYRDDATRPNPPEQDPGTVPLVGYEGRNIERLASGKYNFQIGVYGIDHYHPGAEEHVIAQLQHPVTVEISAPEGTARSDREGRE